MHYANTDDDNGIEDAVETTQPSRKKITISPVQHKLSFDLAETDEQAKHCQDSEPRITTDGHVVSAKDGVLYYQQTFSKNVFQLSTIMQRPPTSLLDAYLRQDNHSSWLCWSGMCFCSENTYLMCGQHIHAYVQQVIQYMPLVFWLMYNMLYGIDICKTMLHGIDICKMGRQHMLRKNTTYTLVFWIMYNI